MKDPRQAKVTETKRKPPVWSVKAGARYVTGFMGNDARKRALTYFAEFEIVQKPDQGASNCRAVAHLRKTACKFAKNSVWNAYHDCATVSFKAAIRTAFRPDRTP